MKELKDMTAQELEDYKRKLYKDNTENGNIQKLYTIARILGEDVPSNYGPKYMFMDEFVQIYVDDYGHYMQVHEGLIMKVSTHNEKLYNPGKWEYIITKHYPEAERIMNEQKAKKEAAKKTDLLNQLS